MRLHLLGRRWSVLGTRLGSLSVDRGLWIRTLGSKLGRAIRILVSKSGGSFLDSEGLTIGPRCWLIDSACDPISVRVTLSYICLLILISILLVSPRNRDIYYPPSPQLNEWQRTQGSLLPSPSRCLNTIRGDLVRHSLVAFFRRSSFLLGRFEH